MRIDVVCAYPVFHKVKLKCCDEDELEKSIIIGLKVKLSTGHVLFWSKQHNTFSVTESTTETDSWTGRSRTKSTKISGLTFQKLQSTYAHCPSFLSAIIFGFELAQNRFKKNFLELGDSIAKI